MTSKDRSSPGFGLVPVHLVWRHRLLVWAGMIIYSVLKAATGRRVPAFCSVSVVICRDGQVLLIDREDRLGYSLPGGFIRSDEQVQDALVREVREETGLQVRPVRLVGIYSGPQRDTRISNVSLAYAAEIISGELARSPEGTPAWHLLGDLPDRLAFDTEQVLRDFALSQRER